ncbi:hypothetical protein PVAP13_5NG544900 [Panicum virgatum]|uniref:Uncharacterized protein n=1 Tax=Panicum virgatum TaxID=38727 RepID=A0A8T0S5V9_PANVG|nr:hypothetical protein PVAP13_5NG544900 [Panicum virgatum]
MQPRSPPPGPLFSHGRERQAAHASSSSPRSQKLPAFPHAATLDPAVPCPDALLLACTAQTPSLSPRLPYLHAHLGPHTHRHAPDPLELHREASRPYPTRAGVERRATLRAPPLAWQLDLPPHRRARFSGTRAMPAWSRIALLALIPSPFSPRRPYPSSHASPPELAPPRPRSSPHPSSGL